MATTLKQLFPDYLTNGGIFDLIEMYAQNPGEEMPYLQYDTISSRALNMKYVGLNSGSKLISPLMEDFVASKPLPWNGDYSDLQGVVEMAVMLYRPNWDRLYDAFITKYNILDNYNAIENEVNARTIANTGTTTNQKGTATTLAKTTTITGADTTVYGKVDTNEVDYLHNFTTTDDDSTTYGKKDTITDTLTLNRTDDTTNTTLHGLTVNDALTMVKNTTDTTNSETDFGKSESINDTLTLDTRGTSDGIIEFGKVETTNNDNTGTNSVNVFNSATFKDTDKNVGSVDSVLTNSGRDTTGDTTTKTGTENHVITTTNGGQDTITGTVKTTGTDTNTTITTNSGTDTVDNVLIMTGTETHATTDTLSGIDVVTRTGTNVGTERNTTIDTLSGADVVTQDQSIVGSDIETQSGSDVIIDNTTTTETNSREWSRVGNIGVNTNQDAILEEINLRASQYLYEYIFADLDKIFTSPIYV